MQFSERLGVQVMVRLAWSVWTQHLNAWIFDLSKIRPVPCERRPGGSLHVSGKLPTYPSRKPAFCSKWEVSVNVGLGEGYVSSFPETYNPSPAESFSLGEFFKLETFYGISPTDWNKI